MRQRGTWGVKVQFKIVFHAIHAKVRSLCSCNFQPNILATIYQPHLSLPFYRANQSTKHQNFNSQVSTKHTTSLRIEAKNWSCPSGIKKLSSKRKKQGKKCSRLSAIGTLQNPAFKRHQNPNKTPIQSSHFAT